MCELVSISLSLHLVHSGRWSCVCVFYAIHHYCYHFMIVIILSVFNFTLNFNERVRESLWYETDEIIHINRWALVSRDRLVIEWVLSVYCHRFSSSHDTPHFIECMKWEQNWPFCVYERNVEHTTICTAHKCHSLCIEKCVQHFRKTM